MNETFNPVNNSDSAIQLRRYENNLIIVGMGIMIFGIWNVAKSVSVLILNKSVYTEMIHAMLVELDPEMEFLADVVFFTVFAITFIILMISIAIRLFIGFSAISVGKNKKKRNLYIPVSFAFIFMGVYEIYVEVSYLITSLSDSSEYVLLISDNPLLSVFIEITSLVMVIELLIASFKIRKLRKEQNISASSEISIKGLRNISDELSDQSNFFEIVE